MGDSESGGVALVVVVAAVVVVVRGGRGGEVDVGVEAERHDRQVFSRARC